MSNLDDRKEASVRLLSTTQADGGSNSSVPVVDEEAPGHIGSGFHNSRQFESTPAAERHRSAAPNNGSGRSDPPTGGKAGGGTQETGSLEYKQYEGGGGRSAPPIGSKTGGSSQETGSLEYKQYDFPDSKVSLADLKPNDDPGCQCKGAEP